MENNVIVQIGASDYTTQVSIGKHILVADEPVELGGTDLGPTPLSMLLSSLGTCKAITMRMYANQKNWPLEGILLSLSAEIKKEGIHQQTFITCAIELKGDLDDMQKERIYKIADRCPIQKILSNPIHIDSKFI